MAIRDSQETYNEYLRLYMLRRYHARMRSARRRLGGKCVRCESAKGLQLDHIDPKTKSFSVSNIASASDARFWKEVDKCQLLCKPCHIEKTLKEKGQRSARGTHGTVSSYRYCHCEKCRAAINACNQARKKRLRR